MDIVLDPATGLPLLPEGKYWKTWEVHFENIPVIRVGMMESTRDKVVDKVVEKTPGTWRNLWKEQQKVVESARIVENEHELMSADMAQHEHVALNPFCEDDANEGRKEAQELCNNGYSFSGYDSLSGETRFTKPFEPTPENLLATAKEVYTSYMKELEKIRLKEEDALKRKALLGTYPPKSLDDLGGSENV